MGAALAECVCGSGAYLDAVIDGLWCICEAVSYTHLDVYKRQVL